WSDSAKWSAATVPNASLMTVYIDNGNASNSVVTLNQNATVRGLSINSGDALNIASGNSLTLTSTATQTFTGVVSSSGNITASSVNVRGAGAELHWDAGTLNIGRIQATNGGKVFLAPGINKTLKVASNSSVDVANGSKIDLADNKMIVTGGAAGS